MEKDIIPIGQIENRIFVLRGKRVMLDSDLVALYGVTTSRLNEQVSRNPDRFPEDFAFSMEKHEVTNLMSQIATSSGNQRRHGGRRKVPRVFTEHGAIMAASVRAARRVGEGASVVRKGVGNGDRRPEQRVGCVKMVERGLVLFEQISTETLLTNKRLVMEFSA